MARLLYVISHSTADPARAATALAAAAAGADVEGTNVALWLSGEGVRLAVEGIPAMLLVAGLPSTSESVARLQARKAPLYVSQPCFARLGFELSAATGGVELVDSARLASLVADGWTPITL